MKRQDYLRRMLSGGLLPLLLAGGLLASCTQEDIPQGNGTPLPDGEYPLRLSAFVETATRATADDMWSGGEQVAVQAATLSGTGVSADWSAAEVATYKVIDADGSMDADTPIYWRKTDEKKVLRAWYCGDGSSASGKENASSVPTEWTVQSDQSGIATLPGGDKDGYQASDLLFTPAVTAAFAGNDAVSLKFCHQTAKVVVNIKNAEYVTDAAHIKAVRIGDGDLALIAPFTAPSDDRPSGTWATDETGANGTITPRKLDAPTDADKYIASYVALVIPQPTAGRRMVAIETDAGVMYYTAPDEAKPLEPGKVRTYNITVKKTELEVTVGESAGWTEDGQTGTGIPAVYRIRVPEGVTVEDIDGSSVTTSATGYYELSGGYMFKVVVSGQPDKFFEDVKLTGNCVTDDKYWTYSSGKYSRIFKTKSDIVVNSPSFVDLKSKVEIGDIYYCDGTWSSELMGKKEPIGIVFYVGRHGKDAQDYKGKPESVKGYVVAMDDSDTSEEFGSGADISGFDTDIENFTGYGRTLTMKEETGFSFETHRAVWQTVNHSPAAPEGSSGWYLPSLGEWNVLWQNYSTVRTRLTAAGGSGMEKDYGFYWSMSKKSSDDTTQPAFVDFGIWMWYSDLNFNDNIRNDYRTAYSRPILTF